MRRCRSPFPPTRQTSKSLERLRCRDAEAEVRAAVREAEEHVGLEARPAIEAPVPEERELALPRAADARLLPAVVARADAVLVIHLAARADAVVHGVLQ